MSSIWDRVVQARHEREVASQYRWLRGQVLRAARARLMAAGHRSVDEHCLAGAYNLAWHEVLRKLAAGEEIQQLASLLVVITARRAQDQLKYERWHEPLDAAGDVETDGDELVDHVSRRETLLRLRDGMAAKLTRRECQILWMHLCHDMSYREIAEAMRLSPRQVERAFDELRERSGGALRRMLDTVREGDWCADHESAVRAYALGWLDPAGERHAVALRHLDHCPACRSRLLATRGVLALLPPAFLPMARFSAGLLGLARSARRMPLRSARRMPPRSARHVPHLSARPWAAAHGAVAATAGKAAVGGLALLAVGAGTAAVVLSAAAHPARQRPVVPVSGAAPSMHVAAPASVRAGKGGRPTIRQGAASPTVSRRRRTVAPAAPPGRIGRAPRQPSAGEFTFEGG